MQRTTMSVKASIIWSVIATAIWCLVSLAFISTALEPLLVQAPALFLMMFFSMRLGALLSIWINKKWPQKETIVQQNTASKNEAPTTDRPEHVRRRRNSSRARTRRKK